jgi:hypothetical protein
VEINGTAQLLQRFSSNVPPAYGRGIYCLQWVPGNKAANIVTREATSCGNLSSLFVDIDVCTSVHHTVMPGWLAKWVHAGQQNASCEIFCASAVVLCLHQEGRARGFMASDQPYSLDTYLLRGEQHPFSIFLIHHTALLGMMIIVDQMFWHFKAFCNLSSCMCLTRE